MSAPDDAPNPESANPEPAKPSRLESLLADFALGPAWARADERKTRAPAHEGKAKTFPQERRDGPPKGRGDGNIRGRGNQDGGGFRQRDGRGHGGPPARGDRRPVDPRPQPDIPAQGVRVTIAPNPDALHLIVKEVHQVARVYSLFDIAATLLADRKRCLAIFEVEEKRPPLWRGKADASLFLTRDEAAAHLWKSREIRDAHLVEETVEVDPPAGNYVAVARCGISGEWLGPPNFHTYQTNLRRLHRERFPNMPFDAYASRVRTERGEEAVNAWLESMKQQTRWRLKSAAEDAPWITDPVEASRALVATTFEEVFEETRRAEITAAIPAEHLSPGLLTCLRFSGTHARRHPAMLIPAVCKALEVEHLPVFKRSGKLFTGPARPLPLPADAILAERPAKMVEWIRSNPPAKLEGLWQAVLPEGGTAPPAEYAADLFWMLQQGHILLFTDDILIVQEHREHSPAPISKKSAKKKKRDRKPAGGTPRDDIPPAASTPDEPGDTQPAADATPADEIPPGDVPPPAAAGSATADPIPEPAEEPPAPIAETPHDGGETTTPPVETPPAVAETQDSTIDFRAPASTPPAAENTPDSAEDPQNPPAPGNGPTVEL